MTTQSVVIFVLRQHPQHTPGWVYPRVYPRVYNSQLFKLLSITFVVSLCKTRTDYQPPRAWGDQVVNRPPIGSGARGPQQNHLSMIDILTLAKEAPGTILAVRADDLMEANTRLIDQVRADLEKELAERNTATLLTREMVLEQLNVSPTTLWRWEKRGYLVPVEVGGQRRYKSTDIKRIMEGDR